MLPCSHVSWKILWLHSVRQDWTHQFPALLLQEVPRLVARSTSGIMTDSDILRWQRALRKCFLCAATRCSRFADADVSLL